MLDRYGRILVTGGAGFIGSHLCDEVLQHVKNVVVVDDLSTGQEKNLPFGVEFYRYDVSDVDKMKTAMTGVDLVFHVAAQPSTRDSIQDPERDFRSNTLGTWAVLTAAREKMVKKVVYTSSSAAYGEPESLPMKETDIPVPGTPYGAGKLCGEHYCSAFFKSYKLPCVILRPFNVYGTRENLDVSLDEVVQFTLGVMNNREITVSGDGSQTRDYAYVKDVVLAHLLAADIDEAAGRVFNIGTGVETSINGLVKTVEEVTGIQARVRQKEWPEGDIRREYGDISLAREILGFSPETSLADGVREIVREAQSS